MRILHAASEVYPLLKTGGLGDVTAALVPALRRLGVEARLLVPGLPTILDGLDDLERVAALPDIAGVGDIALLNGRLRGSAVPAFVIAAPDLYERPGNPYLGPDGKDWPDNHRRFALLGRTAADLAAEIWPADVVHAHDWHAALAPAYLAARGGAGPGSVFTVHNLAFQGLFPPAFLRRSACRPISSPSRAWSSTARSPS